MVAPGRLPRGLREPYTACDSPAQERRTADESASMRAYSKMTTRTRWGRAAGPPNAGCREISAGARLEPLIAGWCPNAMPASKNTFGVACGVGLVSGSPSPLAYFMSKVRDVIGRQKDHDRLRHLKAASSARPMYGFPIRSRLSSCSIRLVEPNVRSRLGHGVRTAKRWFAVLVALAMSLAGG